MAMIDNVDGCVSDDWDHDNDIDSYYKYWQFKEGSSVTESHVDEEDNQFSQKKIQRGVHQTQNKTGNSLGQTISQLSACQSSLTTQRHIPY